jgi:signal recognition particle GTPase
MELNDFYQQIVQLERMGSVRDLMSKIPGLSPLAMPSDFDVDREVNRIRETWRA